MKSKNENILDRRSFVSKSSVLALGALMPAKTYFNFLGSKYEFPLGVITYSFRSMPSSAMDLLDYLTQLNIPRVELMGGPVESFAGAPELPARVRGRDETAAEKMERKKAVENLAAWRSKVSMKKFKELRKKFNAENVQIDIVKFDLAELSPPEINYCFNVAKALGAGAITMERRDEAVIKVGPYADQHKIMVGYHNHAKVNFNSWDKALQVAKYNSVNLDVGHYVAGTNESPVPLIKKYHDRITNLHLKDRKMDNGDNLPWGQGDTPLVEILRLMRDEQYKFMATIELEYQVPDGSDAVKEVGRCADFIRNAIG